MAYTNDATAQRLANPQWPLTLAGADRAAKIAEATAYLNALIAPIHDSGKRREYIDQALLRNDETRLTTEEIEALPAQP